MVSGFSGMQWLRLMLLAVLLAAGAQQARAQMTGEFGHDVAILQNALNATLAATAGSEPDNARVNMEELYRQWRIFRARNFETQSADPRFVPDMENFEAHLFAASKKVDEEEWAAANGELKTANDLLQAVRTRQAARDKPAVK